MREWRAGFRGDAAERRVVVEAYQNPPAATYQRYIDSIEADRLFGQPDDSLPVVRIAASLALVQVVSVAGHPYGRLGMGLACESVAIDDRLSLMATDEGLLIEDAPSFAKGVKAEVVELPPVERVARMRIVGAFSAVRFNPAFSGLVLAGPHLTWQNPAAITDIAERDELAAIQAQWYPAPSAAPAVPFAYTYSANERGRLQVQQRLATGAA